MPKIRQSPICSVVEPESALRVVMALAFRETQRFGSESRVPPDVLPNGREKSTTRTATTATHFLYQFGEYPTFSRGSRALS